MLFLELLDVFFDVSRGDLENYKDDSPEIFRRSIKIEAEKDYNALKEIENEPNPYRRDKMRHMYNLGVTDFSGI